jgi:hypothetical protein
MPVNRENPSVGNTPIRAPTHFYVAHPRDGVLTADEIRVMARAQAQAQPAAGGRRRGGPQGMMMRMDPIFAALDTNRDNAIAADEIDNAPAALRTLDKNHDGKLTEDEVRPNFGPGRGFNPRRPEQR